jgi:amidophosphoribosyltransferase
VALAHNGQLVNQKTLNERVLGHGVGLLSDSDSEIIAQMLCAPPPPPSSEHLHGIDFVARIKAFMSLSTLAYSLACMCNGAVYAVRDPFGNRPLCIGKLINTKRDVWVVASETCAFFPIGAELVREVRPGEILRLDENGMTTMATVERTSRRIGRSRLEIADSVIGEVETSRPSTPIPPALCIFEYVYFSRPDSILEQQVVHIVRRRCGVQLAKEKPVDADVVSNIPTTSTPAALGFAYQSGVPYDEVLCKNRYVGRTFIEPDQRIRDIGVTKKFSPIIDNIKDKRIVLVDDSIVRGTTIKPLIIMLRKHGAKEVHIRIASPPVKYPCFMGINIPTRNELVANQVPFEKLASYFGADSVEYLSLEGLRTAVQNPNQAFEERGHCTACLTGEYPVNLEF